MADADRAITVPRYDEAVAVEVGGRAWAGLVIENSEGWATPWWPIVARAETCAAW